MYCLCPLEYALFDPSFYHWVQVFRAHIFRRKIRRLLILEEEKFSAFFVSLQLFLTSNGILWEIFKFRF